jgi:hypothetical protein
VATYRAVLVTRVPGRLRRGKAFVTLQYGDDRYVVREAVFCHVLIMELALLDSIWLRLTLLWVVEAIGECPSKAIRFLTATSVSSAALPPFRFLSTPFVICLLMFLYLSYLSVFFINWVGCAFLQPPACILRYFKPVLPNLSCLILYIWSDFILFSLTYVMFLIILIGTIFLSSCLSLLAL